MKAVRGARIDSPAGAAVAVLALAISVLAFCAAPATSFAATCPNETSRVGLSEHLPECRVFELATPGLNNAAPSSWPEVEVQGMTADGSALAFIGASSPFDAEGATAPTNTLLTRRGPAGWTTKSLSAATPLASGTYFGKLASTVGLSEDLTQSVLWSDQPLAGGSSPAGNNLYLRRADGSIIPLTTIGAAGLDPGSFLAGASRDFSRLFLDTNVKQLAEDPLLNGNIYEYSAGTLRLELVRNAELLWLIGAGSRSSDMDEAIRIRERQRLEEHRLDYAEDGGVGSDGKGERRHDGERETRGAGKAARRVPEIPDPRFDCFHLPTSLSHRAQFVPLPYHP